MRKGKVCRDAMVRACERVIEVKAMVEGHDEEDGHVVGRDGQ